ncbi:MAG: hypothetical protein WAX89_01755, partial [Alphaproteobacteria bacterium]
MALKIDTQSLAQILADNSAATQEAAASNKAAAGVAKAKPWQVPQLDEGFQLAPALHKAFEKVEGFMNKLLEPDGLNIDVALQHVDFAQQGELASGAVRDAADG